LPEVRRDKFISNAVPYSNEYALMVLGDALFVVAEEEG
jgi:hypothetical protein